MAGTQTFTDEEIKESLIRILEAELSSESNLTFVFNKLFDRRYNYKKELEGQLEEAEAKVRVLKSKIAQGERFGSTF